MKKNMKKLLSIASVSDIEGIRKLFIEVDELHLKLLPFHFKSQKNGRRKAEVEDWIDKKDRLFLVCKSGKEIVGLLNARISSAPTLPFIKKVKTMVIETLVVSKKERKRGIGNDLLSQAEAWAIQKKVQRLTLNVFVKNESALEFYKNRHYQEVSVKMEKEIRKE